MDAPVEHEDCRPFIKVANELFSIGLNVPEVIEQNLQQGFLLLSDLGSTTYLSVLNEVSESRVDQLYGDALEALVQLQSRGSTLAKGLPAYDETLLRTEMSLFPDWLLETHLQVGLNAMEKSAWNEVQSVLVKSAVQQPQTYVHRDYHSRNLMVVDQGNPGILDFQDAVKGPLTYDAVSMLRDCYIAWPEDQVVEWQRQYFFGLVEKNMAAKTDWTGFQKSIDLMGIQRHLKASGIFARLYHRDGKSGYLNDIPLTLEYIVKVGKHYPELKTLVGLVDEKVLPNLDQPH